MPKHPTLLALAMLLTGGTAQAQAPASAPTPAATDCRPDPLAGRSLYLRGSPAGWTADDEFRFSWACTRWELATALAGEHRFKIADEAWSADADYGRAGGDGPYRPGVALAARGGALDHVFNDSRQLVTVTPSAPGGAAATLDISPWQPGMRQPPGAPPPVADPVAASLRFDSRDAQHKVPFGAVTAGSTVRFAVSAQPGVEAVTLVLERRTLTGNQDTLFYTERQRLPMQRQRGADGRDTFRVQQRFDEVAVHGYWFEATVAGQRYALQNNRQRVPWTRERGTGGAGEVALLPVDTASIRRYRLSVYQSGFQVPAWAADTVWYYIFPERFRNGDKTNDPQPGQRQYHDQTVELHARWAERPFKPHTGDGSDTVYNNDFFGGDLQGVIDKLDHLKRLGINAIYLTPVFEAASNHKYDTADYHRIDPGFGRNADFTRLTAEAARRGIRVVPDASLNHTGADSRYFDRFGNYGANADVGAFRNGRIEPGSPYASWYSFKPGAATPEQAYTGWVGVADLPELDKNAPAWRDFAYRAPGSITRHWLQAGASGWRMDVAPWVPDDFWREWRQVVKTEKPDAITIAETWFDPAKHLLGDMFDATMNYIFRDAVLDFAKGGPASTLAAQMELLRESVPPPAQGALMNLLSSHDVPRALHVLGHSGAQATPPAVALALRRYRLTLLLQMSHPGAPAVYYGDEVGVTGGEDPYNRAPYPWADEGGRPDLALQAEVQRLIALRHAQPVLRHGGTAAPLLADAHTVVWARALPAGSPRARAGAARQAITAFNNADEARSVTVALPAGWAPGARLRDALDGSAWRAQGGRLTITLPALSGRVLLVR